MSLSTSKLSSNLQAMTNTDSFSIAGQAWASAYGPYAADGQTVLNHPLSVSPAQATLATALASAFAASLLPATLAPLMAAAFTSFWLSPPIVFVGSFVGGVTAVTGTAALQAALISAMASNIAGKLTRAQCSDAMAAALDAFTKTVVVTTATVPTPTVGPIS